MEINKGSVTITIAVVIDFKDLKELIELLPAVDESLECLRGVGAAEITGAGWRTYESGE